MSQSNASRKIKTPHSCNAKHEAEIDASKKWKRYPLTQSVYHVQKKRSEKEKKDIKVVLSDLMVNSRCRRWEYPRM